MVRLSAAAQKMDLQRILYYIQHLTLSPFVAAGVFVCTALILVVVLKLLFFRSRPKKYLTVVSDSYNSGASVINALKQAEEVYSKKSRERVVIHAAVRYLTKSVLRDYPTAFRVIESEMSSKKVKKLHQMILENEKNRKNEIFMLSGPCVRAEERE